MKFECSGGDDSKVHEILPRVLGVFVEIKNVADGKFASGDHHAVLSLSHGELVEVCIDLLDFTAEVDGLLKKCSLDTRKRIARAFARIIVHKAGNAMEVAQRETLVDFRVDPDLTTPPWSQPSIEGHVPALAPRV